LAVVKNALAACSILVNEKIRLENYKKQQKYSLSLPPLPLPAQHFQRSLLKSLTPQHH
jgi:hypothetical protein